MALHTKSTILREAYSSAREENAKESRDANQKRCVKSSFDDMLTRWFADPERFSDCMFANKVVISGAAGLAFIQQMHDWKPQLLHLLCSWHDEKAVKKCLEDDQGYR